MTASGVQSRMRVWGDGVRTRLWPVPVAGVVVSVALGVALPEVDRRLQRTGRWQTTVLLFGGGADAARTVLSAVAGSLVTVTSLTFSLTVVTLQLASSQYSPRLLRAFTRDGFVQATLALFLSTFSYALTVLRVVRSDDGSQAPEFVPRLSVTVAFALTIASVLGLVLFLAHLTREIRVETVLARVHAETVEVAARVFSARGTREAADPPAPPSRPWHEVSAVASGFITAIDHRALLAMARDLQVTLFVDVQVGDFVVAGQPVGRAWRTRAHADPDDDPDQDAEQPPVPHLDLKRVAKKLTVGEERTSVQDVGFGLRQISDVVAKALSPGINDPTTAVHALGWSSALLVALAGRRCGPLALPSEDEQVLVVVARPAFADLVRIALEQPLLYGRGDPQVMDQIMSMLLDLARAVQDPDGRITVRAELSNIREALDLSTLSDHATRRLVAACDTVEVALRLADTSEIEGLRAALPT